MQYDVVIIGGGITGCAIARELSRYSLKLALVEACEDVAMGASRANSAIVHAGYDCEPGSRMAEMNVRGNARYDAWCADLEVPLQRIGSLVIGFDDADEAELQRLYEKGRKNGVPDLRIIRGDEARLLEPQLHPAVTAALWAPTGAITCPYQLTIACAENAKANGASFMMQTKVTRVDQTEDGFVLHCADQTIETHYVINAAGVYADEVARLIGDDSFQIKPRKGEYMLLDHQANCMQRVIFQTPSAMGKGVLVSPTVDNNVFAGPTAVDVEDKADTETTDAGMQMLRTFSLRSVPALNLRAVITSFAGVRAVPSTGDFILRASEKSKRWIHAAGICSPGLSSAPAIAEEVADLLREQGMSLTPRNDFQSHRVAIKRFVEMDRQEREAMIAQNPLYGRIICRCETITEGEIVEAIHRGARSVDGVKRRTRAGMGRCQGGFCSPRVMQILARELQVPMTTLTKFGGASKLLLGKLKEVQPE